MAHSPIALLLVTRDEETSRFVADLLLAGNRANARQIILDTLLVSSLNALHDLAPRSLCNLILVDYPGEVTTAAIQDLRHALPNGPLIILGDQECIAEDLPLFQRAGIQEYLVRAHLTSHWLRHVVLRSAQGTPVQPVAILNHHHYFWGQLANLFAEVPVMICTFTGPEHVYTYANQLYLRVVGNRDIIGKPIRQALPELAGQDIFEVLDEVYANRTPYIAQERRVWLQNTPDGPLEECYFTYVYAPVLLPSPFVDAEMVQAAGEDASRSIFVVALEVSELVRLRYESQEAHAQLNALFASAPLGLAFVDHQLRFSRINPALANMNGLPPEFHLGKTPEMLVPNVDSLAHIMAQWRHILETGESIIGVEVTGRTAAAPDEDRVWEEYWFPVWLNNEISGIGIVAEDVTQRKRVEAEREHLLEILAQERRWLDELNQTLEQRVNERSQQVRDLASELTIAEQRERYRISQILHDHIQQLLYGIDFRIALLGNSATADQRELLDEFKEIVQEAIRATRTLAVELSPPVLRGEGLEQALQWLAHQMQVIHALHVSLDVEEPTVVPRVEMRVLILQSVRELLFNVVKHARTAAAHVTLHQIDDQFVIEVIDQGEGFQMSGYVDRPRPVESLGLFSVRERLQLFGGMLEITSVVGQGTRAVMTLPIAA